MNGSTLTFFSDHLWSYVQKYFYGMVFKQYFRYSSYFLWILSTSVRFSFLSSHPWLFKTCSSVWGFGFSVKPLLSIHKKKITCTDYSSSQEKLKLLVCMWSSVLVSFVVIKRNKPLLPFSNSWIWMTKPKSIKKFYY